MPKDFNRAVMERRSIYGIKKESPISDERILELVNHGVLHCPTAFNSQNGRVVVLLGKNHDKLWDITIENLRKRMPENRFAATEEKLRSFQRGYGTILYFEDLSIVEKLQQQFPKYSDSFPLWSLQAIGMLQYIIWASLENEGLGASLQHYNPVIDDEVNRAWDIPAHWRLIAQMPFGAIAMQPGEKQFQPIEERIKVYR